MCEPVLRGLSQDFVEEFFDQNPLSQLGIVVTWKGAAEKLSELSGNKSVHLEVRPALRRCVAQENGHHRLCCAAVLCCDVLCCAVL